MTINPYQIICALDFDDFSNLDAPPPPPSGPKVVFIPYDDPPVALSPIRPNYPEIAQEAGIEGVVVVQAFIEVVAEHQALQAAQQCHMIYGQAAR